MWSTGESLPEPRLFGAAMAAPQPLARGRSSSMRCETGATSTATQTNSVDEGASRVWRATSRRQLGRLLDVSYARVQQVVGKALGDT